MRLFIALTAPYRWAVVDRKDNVVDRGTREDLEDYRKPAKVDQVIGVAPGEAVVTRTASIPGKRRGNVEAALPFALEETLTEDVERLHFTLMDWSADQPARAAVVGRTQLEQWLADFRNLGISLDMVVPDYLLLPLHPTSEITAARLDDGLFLLRQGRFSGLALDEDSFEYWLDGLESGTALAVNRLDLARDLMKSGQRDVSHWEIGHDFTAWLEQPGVLEDLEKLSILKGDFAPGGGRQRNTGLKLAAAIAAIAFFAYWGYSFMEYRELKAEHRSLEKQIVRLFLKSFPGEPWLDRPRSQVESLVNRARTGNASQTDFQQYLNVISAITPQYGAVIEEIGYRENVLELVCTVRDLSSLDTVKQALDAFDGIDAELVSSGARDNKITGRFRLSRS